MVFALLYAKPAASPVCDTTEEADMVQLLIVPVPLLYTKPAAEAAALIWLSVTVTPVTVPEFEPMASAPVAEPVSVSAQVSMAQFVTEPVFAHASRAYVPLALATFASSTAQSLSAPILETASVSDEPESTTFCTVPLFCAKTGSTAPDIV